MSRILVGGVALVAVLAAVVFSFGPGLIEGSQNRVLRPSPYIVRPEVQQLHDSLFVADLHSDSLLWHRDLLAKGSRAHVDVPRLQEGGVALQVFSVVTKVPASQNYDSNPGDSDLIGILTVLQRWPRPTWSGLLARALYQAERLRDAASRSYESVSVIRSAADLDDFLARRRQIPRLTAALLAIEGMHAIEGQLANIDVLYDAGFRMMGLTHFFDNDLAGSVHGVEKGGLSELGRGAVRRMEELGILIDLAHASPRAIDEVLDTVSRPVVISHTGVKGACDHVRNVSDAHVRRVAANGGVIGVGYWDAAVCDVSAAGIVRSMRYIADLVGVDHIALGSDFDGATTTPFDTSGVPLITAELVDAGFSEGDIGKIMGANVLRVLRSALPPGAPAAAAEQTS
jgi:microsomal dipeptidase-like Zn-dependent dipeptidase